MRQMAALGNNLSEEERREERELRRAEFEAEQQKRLRDLRRYCLEHAMSLKEQLGGDPEMIVRFASTIERYVTDGNRLRVVERPDGPSTLEPVA